MATVVMSEKGQDWVGFFGKRAFILMYKVSGHGGYFSTKGRYFAAF